MKAIAKRPLGRTGLQVTAMGYGAAPVGNFSRPIADATAHKMIDGAYEAGLNYFDTAPMYGHGLSEARVGEALRWRERVSFVLSSKVGRRLVPTPRAQIEFDPWNEGLPFAIEFDYSYDGAMRAYEDSIQRTGLERWDIAYIHDCDKFSHGAQRQPEVFRQAMQGACKALLRLRDEGVVKAIGLGVNEHEVCHEALKQADLDCFLLAGRYTLLEQDALDGLLPLCVERGASVVVGGGFNSGILATGAKEGAKYNYAPAPEEIMQRVARIERVCADWEVELPAAALQFVLAHPAVASIIPGTRTMEQLDANLRLIEASIPEGFWQQLRKESLIREDAPTPSVSD